MHDAPFGGLKPRLTSPSRIDNLHRLLSYLSCSFVLFKRTSLILFSSFVRSMDMDPARGY